MKISIIPRDLFFVKDKKITGTLKQIISRDTCFFNKKKHIDKFF